MGYGSRPSNNTIGRACSPLVVSSLEFQELKEESLQADIYTLRDMCNLYFSPMTLFCFGSAGTREDGLRVRVLL